MVRASLLTLDGDEFIVEGKELERDYGAEILIFATMRGGNIRGSTVRLLGVDPSERAKQAFQAYEIRFASAI